MDTWAYGNGSWSTGPMWALDTQFWMALSLLVRGSHKSLWLHFILRLVSLPRGSAGKQQNPKSCGKSILLQITSHGGEDKGLPSAQQDVLRDTAQLLPKNKPYCLSFWSIWNQSGSQSYGHHEHESKTYQGGRLYRKWCFGSGQRRNRPVCSEAESLRSPKELLKENKQNITWSFWIFEQVQSLRSNLKWHCNNSAIYCWGVKDPACKSDLAQDALLPRLQVADWPCVLHVDAACGTGPSLHAGSGASLYRAQRLAPCTLCSMYPRPAPHAACSAGAWSMGLIQTIILYISYACEASKFSTSDLYYHCKVKKKKKSAPILCLG